MTTPLKPVASFLTLCRNRIYKNICSVLPGGGPFYCAYVYILTSAAMCDNQIGVNKRGAKFYPVPSRGCYAGNVCATTSARNVRRKKMFRYFFIFNDALSSSDYMSLKCSIISDYRIEEFVEGSGHDIF
jgi:hypothetical protein